VFDAPAVTISVNRLWLPFLTGGLFPYTDPDLWQGSSDDQFDASQEVMKLLGAFADASIPEEGVIVSDIDFAFGTPSPALIRAVHPLETADEVLLTVDSPFDSGSLTVGDDVEPARLLSIPDLSLLAAGDQIQVSPQYKYASATDVKVYRTGAPTSGAARITLYSFREV
jgi:hypothetical protein